MPPTPSVDSTDVRTAVLRMAGVTKTYLMGEFEVHALRGVDFELFSGEFLVLLGAFGGAAAGIVYGLDYRNELVLAAFRALPDLHWGLVAKIDMVPITRMPVQK